MKDYPPKILLFFGAISTTVIIFFYTLVISHARETNLPGSLCLNTNQQVIISFEKYQGTDLSRVDGTTTITVLDKNSKIEASTFSSDILNTIHYHPIETHSCGVYFARQSNYDYVKHIPLKNYTAAIWKFDYSGRGTELVRLGNDSSSGYVNEYSDDFRVDPAEKYIVLERGYMSDGKDDYALVIKDINTKQDVFTLKASDLQKKYPQLMGEFMMLDWTTDGRYFWANIFEDAYVDGWVRIDTKDWSYEGFVAPEGILGGYPLNLETGWVPLIPGAFWTGFQEGDDQVKAERLAGGKTADLYLYNLFTKKQILVEDTNEPIWRGLEGKWISDSEFQYSMPDGSRKTYTIPN